MSRRLTYAAVGATQPAEASWGPGPRGFRRYERSVRIGRGPGHWQFASSQILRWGVKTRSGFTVEPAAAGDVVAEAATVREGVDYRLVAHVGPLRIHEPVRVVAVTEKPDRCGFAYGTLEGHPVCGEEAFVVHRTADDVVWLTLRSLTRAAPGAWRVAFPALLVAQRHYRRRYLRALRERPA